MKILKDIPVWIWLCVASILPLISLITPGFPITHDGPDHVARIANFYMSLREGILIPRWAGNLNWGYGHPILMFLYPLPSYLASIAHSVGFSFVDSTKIVFALAFMSSIFAMFIWLRQIVDEQSAIVGALLYGFAPYRFVDLYVRGALGEHVAFIFPPLVCYFLHALASNNHSKRKLLSAVGCALSFAGLLLAHNAIALMCIPLFILYGIYLMRYESKSAISFIILSKCSILLGFGLAAFFWIPAFFEGKYTLRDIVTAGEVLQRFVPWTQFFYSPWSYGGTDLLSKSLGVAGLSVLATSLYLLLFTKEQKNRTLLIGSVSTLIFMLFLMTEVSKPIWTAITLLQKFQFPWRFLSVTTFLIALIGALVSQSMKAKISKRIISYAFIAYALFIVSSTVNMWYPKGYKVRNESAFTGIYLSTTDTGESSPIWSIRFMEHTPTSKTQVIRGDAIIEQTMRTSTKRDYTITAVSPSRILENTLYFPGWNIYIDGRKTAIQFQDPEYRGLMTYDISEGTHTVSIRFEDTRVRKVSQYISMISILIVCIILFICIVWKRKQ